MVNLIKKYKNNDTISQIIIVNIIVALLSIIMTNSIVLLFSLPLTINVFIVQPWSLFTAMFVHSGFMHIFFNMIWLYIMGNILMKNIGENKIWKLFIYSGLVVNLFALLFSIVIGGSGYAVGSSGAVNAIVFAAIYSNPEEEVSFFGIITFKIKYIGIYLFISTIIGLFGLNNIANFAHFIGLIYGYIWIKKINDRNFIEDIVRF